MKVDSATAGLTEELGALRPRPRSPNTCEISVEDVLEAIEAGYARRTVSLDAPRRADGEDPTPEVEMLPARESGFDRVEAELASGQPGSTIANGRCCG